MYIYIYTFISLKTHRVIFFSQEIKGELCPAVRRGGAAFVQRRQSAHRGHVAQGALPQRHACGEGVEGGRCARRVGGGVEEREWLEKWATSWETMNIMGHTGRYRYTGKEHS